MGGSGMCQESNNDRAADHIKEIALAQKAMVHCGGSSVSWIKVADAVALLEREGRDGAVSRMFKKSPAINHVPGYIGSISSMPAYRLVQNTTGLFRGQELEFRTWRYTLEELVSFLAAFKASRAHDTIYAILGLASDFKPVHPSVSRSYTANFEHPVPGVRKVDTSAWTKTIAKADFEVDYQKPVLAVFKDFMQKAIDKSKSLDIICRPWAPTSGFNAEGVEETYKLPSWIAVLSKKPFQATKEGKMVRFNPDPLVGPPVYRHTFYSASGSEPMECDIETQDDTSNTMTVRGFVLDHVENVWDSGMFGSVPPGWLEAGQWTDVEKPPPDELWRTLVADRNPAGYDPDRWYPSVFQSIAKDKGLSYGFETYRLIHETTVERVNEVFRRVQAVVWNRRLIRTEGQFMQWWAGTEDVKVSGALGMAPNDAKPGDLICIIFGCSVPLLLRKVQTPQVPQRRRSSGVSNMTSTEVGQSTVLPPTVNDSVGNGNREGGDGENGVPRDGTEENGVPRDGAGEGTSTGHDNGEDVSTRNVDVNGQGAGGANCDLYTLVGECYIDHMMDGEAIAYYQDKGIPARDFTII
jgi:hypothetical protein